ncbi:MAG: hypothetical protein HQK91_08670 [Nitrospirae bacterium]|nr:hypothetical protein [Nitrospirota bacterium]
MHRFKLWQLSILMLTVPIAVMLVLFYFELRGIKGEYFDQIKIIQSVDDISIDLLEVRRYEKNVLLYRDEGVNSAKYHEYIDRLKREVNNLQEEIINLMGEEVFNDINVNLNAYEKLFEMLNHNIDLKVKLLSQIRTLGRKIEHDSTDKMAVFDLRRKEKNYLIYKETSAIDDMQTIVSSLKIKQPNLRNTLDQYLKNMLDYVSMETAQMDILLKMRNSAREIEYKFNHFSKSKRSILNLALHKSEIFFIVTAVFIIVLTIFMGSLFSRKIVKDLKEIEKSLESIIRDDFSFRELTIHDSLEIESFNINYNKNLRKLKINQTETNKLIDKLGELNNLCIKQQNEIIESRKAEAMKLFASEICHEINNPLSSILSFLSIMYEELHDGDSNKDLVRIMLKETNRCHMLVHKLSEYAKNSMLNLREINIKSLVNDAIRIQKGMAAEKDVSLFLSGSVDVKKKCMVDTALISQVFTNIITNAIKFSHQGGLVFVCIKDVEKGVNISIGDEGIGIPQDELSMIFKPFFSTQKESGGTGLGLAIAKKIVERHGGMISVESTVNEGTVLTIYLPGQEKIET